MAQVTSNRPIFPRSDDTGVVVIGRTAAVIGVVVTGVGAAATGLRVMPGVPVIAIGVRVMRGVRAGAMPVPGAIAITGHGAIGLGAIVRGAMAIIGLTRTGGLLTPLPDRASASVSGVDRASASGSDAIGA